MQKNKTLLLLRTMLKSTSTSNLLKHCTDKKRRSQAIGGIIGYVLIYIVIIMFGTLQAVGMGFVGMGDMVPSACAMAVSAIAFIFTLMKSNGYLFGFKEYDMLMSMPFEVKTIVSCKFMYMFIKSLPMPLCLVVSMLIGYGIMEKPPVYVYPIWIILSLAVLLIPTIIASAIDAFITRLGSGMRFKKAMQAIFLMAFCIACFFSRFIIDAIVRSTVDGSDDGYNMISQAGNFSKSSEKYYWPVKWFNEAIISHRISSMLLLVAIALLLFAGYYTLISRKYCEINTRLAAHERRKGRVAASFKKKNIYISIAQKELKRFFGSVPYFVNVGMGHVLTLIMSVAFVVVGGQKVIMLLTNNAPFDAMVVVPAIPFIVYFFMGMVATTCVTPSLEGKNAWIMQTMPLEKMTINKGKMLFNLAIGLPFAWIGTTLLSISFRCSFIVWLTCMALITAQMLFSTTFGMVCGLKHIKLEWENEVEVVKQGAAVGIYLFINMIISMIGLAGSIAMGFVMTTWAIELIFAALYALVGFLFYLKVKKMK